MPPGGWVGAFLAGIAVLATVAVVISLDRARVLLAGGRPAADGPSRTQARAVADLLNAGQIEAARSRGRKSGPGPAALADAAGAAWEEPDGALHDRLESAAGCEIGRLERGVWLLALVANLAALLGYFGAIAAMLDAFSLLSAAGLDKPELLGTLIRRALFATFTGLAVAAPALAAYSVFTARIAARVRELETWADALFSAHDAGFRELTPPAAGW
jgi:biopolymer transport protein ExbB/TolQ